MLGVRSGASGKNPNEQNKDDIENGENSSSSKTEMRKPSQYSVF